MPQTQWTCEASFCDTATRMLHGAKCDLYADGASQLCMVAAGGPETGRLSVRAEEAFLQVSHLQPERMQCFKMPWRMHPLLSNMLQCIACVTIRCAAIMLPDGWHALCLQLLRLSSRRLRQAVAVPARLLHGMRERHGELQAVSCASPTCICAARLLPDRCLRLMAACQSASCASCLHSQLVICLPVGIICKLSAVQVPVCNLAGGAHPGPAAVHLSRHTASVQM